MGHRYVLRRGNKISKVLGGNAVIELARKGRLRESDEIRDVKQGSWIYLKDVSRLNDLGTLRPPVAAIPSSRDEEKSPDATSGVAKPGRALTDANEFFRQKSLPISLLLIAGFLPFLLPEFGFAPFPTLVWAVAILGLAGVWSIWRNLLQPGRGAIKWAVFSALFSSVFGASTLFQFANLAIILSESQVSWQDLPLWLVSRAGPIYSRAMEGDLLKDRPIYEVLASLSLSVGFMEEFIKLLPVWLVYHTRSVRDPRGLFFTAAASAIGFGVAEGIWYAYATLLPDGRLLSAFACRFVSGPCGHAALSILALTFFFTLRPFRSAAAERFTALRTATAWAASTMAVGVVHGLYDTLLLQHYFAPASIVMAVVLCIGCVGFQRAVPQDRKEPNLLNFSE